MTDITHPEMVATLVKKGDAIVNEITAKVADLWHGATGVSTEVGELLEAVMAHAIHGLHADRDHLIEEFGDLEFYMEQVRQNLGLMRVSFVGASNDGCWPIRDVSHLAVEAAKLLDAAKKRAIYGKEEVEALAADALSEMERHMEKLRFFFQITRDETLAANIAKLKVRYEGLVYSNEAAAARADKAPGE